MASLLEKGEVVLLPFGDNERYDLVIDEDGTFTRIQCKTGRLRNGVIVVKTCSYGRDGSTKKDYIGSADKFGIYCPENDKTYLVPVSEVGSRGVYLRIDPPKNNQINNIRWAKDYEY